MEIMTTRRWLAIVAVSCAVLATILLPPSEDSTERFVRSRQRPEAVLASGLYSRIGRLNEATQMLSLRDTLLRATLSSGAAPRLIAPSNLKEGERARLEQSVREHAALVGRGADRVVVGVVNADTSTGIPRRTSYRTERDFIVPAATDGERCIMLIRVGYGQREMPPDARRGILGPCAFFAAFGTPGPAIGEWLNKREYDVGLVSLWPASTQPNPGLLDVRRTTREEDLARYLDFGPARRNTRVNACSAGDKDVCTSSLHRRTLDDADRGYVPQGFYKESSSFSYYSPLGSAAGYLLSDLLAEQGQARFEKFWKSPAKFEDAFQNAFGVSSGEWTMKWMRYRYGPESRGPYISPRSAIFTFITALGAVALGAASAVRREIG